MSRTSPVTGVQSPLKSGRSCSDSYVIPGRAALPPRRKTPHRQAHSAARPRCLPRLPSETETYRHESRVPWRQNLPGPPAPCSVWPSANVACSKCPPLRPSFSGQYSMVILSPALMTVGVQPRAESTLGDPFSNAYRSYFPCSVRAGHVHPDVDVRVFPFELRDGAGDGSRARSHRTSRRCGVRMRSA